MAPVRALLMAGVALCGLTVVVPSLLTWVRFETASGIAPSSVTAETSGIHTSVWRDNESIDEHSVAPHGTGWCTCEVGFGDGYITAVLGFVMIGSAAAVALRDAGWGLVTAALSALATVVAAGFNAFADWSALISTTNAGTTAVADGEVQFALYVIVGAGGLAAVLSTAAWAADRSAASNREYDYEDDPDKGLTEGTESWA